VGVFLKITESDCYDGIYVRDDSPKRVDGSKLAEGDPQILFDDVDWYGSVADGVEIVGAKVPVVVQNCRFTLTDPTGPVLRILECADTITVTGCNFFGAGVTVLDSPGVSTISQNTIQVDTYNSSGINLGSSGDATASNNSVVCADNILAAVTVSGMTGTSNFTNNTIVGGNALLALSIGENRVLVNGGQVVGMISLVNGPVNLTGIDLAGASVQDPLGALMSDPVEGNSGLSPYNCYTICDFDGNGCCDYPPPNNEPDGNGQCPCEGVPPASK
jgi:hypothetical protein